MFDDTPQLNEMLTQREFAIISTAMREHIWKLAEDTRNGENAEIRKHLREILEIATGIRDKLGLTK